MTGRMWTDISGADIEMVNPIEYPQTIVDNGPTLGEGFGALLVPVPVGVTQGGTGTTIPMTPGSVIFAGLNGVYTQDNPMLFWDDTHDGLGVGTTTPQGKLNVNSTPAASLVGTGFSNATTVNIWDSNSAAPVTVANPSAIIARREQLNGVDGTNGANAALVVSSIGNNTSPSSGEANGQTNGITAYATQNGSGDVVGGFFIAQQEGAATSGGARVNTAFGVFAQADAITPSCAAVGMNPNVGNLTGVDYHWASLAANPQSACTIGVSVQGQGTNLNTVGVTFYGPAPMQFDVGVGFLPGSTLTADIQSNSSAVTSYKGVGSYTYGIDFSGATISAADLRLHSGNTFRNPSAGVVAVDSAQFLQNIGTSSGPTPLNTATGNGAVLSDSSPSGCQIGTWNVATSLYPTFIQARNHGAASLPYSLLLQPLGGSVLVGAYTGAPPQLLTVNGGAANSTGVWATISEREFKEEIAAYDPGLAVINQLKPVTFRYAENAPITSERRHLGLIADEVEPVAPEIVVSAGEHRLLEPGNLIYALINAVKELSARVEELEATKQ